jgi:hypothetical protein
MTGEARAREGTGASSSTGIADAEELKAIGTPVGHEGGIIGQRCETRVNAARRFWSALVSDRREG